MVIKIDFVRAPLIGRVRVLIPFDFAKKINFGGGSTIILLFAEKVFLSINFCSTRIF